MTDPYGDSWARREIEDLKASLDAFRDIMCDCGPCSHCGTVYNQLISTKGRYTPQCPLCGVSD